MTNNQLQAVVERIEKLEEEKAVIAEDIKEVYSEAKGNGFDPKIIKKIIALRKQDAKKRAEEQALLAVYMDALGMLAGTPLGQSAVASAQLRSSKAAAMASFQTTSVEEDLADFD
jgi:uncharacterized protein (UPF0335 family)